MQVEEALEQFENAWKAGGPPDVRQAVEQVGPASLPANSRSEFVCELLMIDFWHRWRRAADRPQESGLAGSAGFARSLAAENGDWPAFPRLDDYARHYADLLDWTNPPPQLIGEEYRVRRWFGEHPTHDEYLRRFPLQSDHLPLVLARIDAQTSRGLHETTQTAPLPHAPLVPPAAQPAMIGKYQILATLDEGGQGRVYRAMHPELRQELAIKVGHPISARSEREQNALVAEARVLAQLNHPHLVRVHDLGFHEGCPYVVLDYVPGRNLRELSRSQRLSPARAAGIVAKIARAVAAAHAHGVTHLDLKPGNILIDQQGEPRLIDFGLARQRSAFNSLADGNDQIGGTLLYMAPEQARGDAAQIGCRSDVFGLGAVLYDLLVGHPPRAAKSKGEMLAEAEDGVVDDAPLSDPKIPAGLAAICRKALAKEPGERPESAESFAEAIEAWQQTSGRGAATNRKLVAALLIMLLLGIAVAFASAKRNAALPSSAVEQQAAALVGHAPRHDFPLQFEIVGQDRASVAKLRDGDAIAVRLQSDVDCYVGLWHLDAAGKATLLFPNDREQDHFTRAGTSLTIPGRDGYAIEVSTSDGREYLWLAALTQPWDAEVGRDRGPAIALAAHEELLRPDQRAANLVDRTAGRVSERVIELRVAPRSP